MKKLLSLLLVLFGLNLHAQNGATFVNSSGDAVSFRIKCTATGYNSGTRGLGAHSQAIIYDFYGPNTYIVECMGTGTTVIWTTSFNAPAAPYVNSCATIEVGSYLAPKWKWDGVLNNNTDYMQKYYVDIGADGTYEYTYNVAPHTFLELHFEFESPRHIKIIKETYSPGGTPRDEQKGDIPVNDPGWYPEGGTPPASTSPVNDNPEVPSYNPNGTDPTPNINFPDTTDLAKEQTLRTGLNALRSSMAQGFQAMVDAIGSGFNALKGKLDQLLGLQGNLSELPAIKQNTANTAANTATTADRVATVANNTATANTKLDGLGAKLEGIGGNVLQTANNTGEANTKLQSIDSKIETANTKLQVVADHANTAAQKLTEIADGQGTGVKDAIETMNTSVGGKLDTANNKLQVIADHAATGKDTLASILASGNASKDQLTAIKAWLSDHPWATPVDLENHRLSTVAFKDQAHADLGRIESKQTEQATAAKQDAQRLVDEGIKNVLETTQTQNHNDANRIFDQAAAVNEHLVQVKANQGTIMGHTDAIKRNSEYLPGISANTGQIAANTAKNGQAADDIRGIKEMMPDVADNVKKIEGHTRNLTNQMDSILNWSNRVSGFTAIDAAAKPISDQAKGSVTAASNRLASGYSTGVSSGNIQWKFQLLDWEIDLNPMNQSWFAQVAAFLRKLFTWLIAIWAFGEIFTYFSKSFFALLANGVSAMASHIPGVNMGLGLVVKASLATVAFVAPVAGLSEISGEIISSIHANPFEGWGGIIGTGIWLLDQVFPVAFFLSTWLYIFTLKHWILGMFVSSAAYKWLAHGAIAFLLVSSVEAANVTVKNLSGAPVQIGDFCITGEQIMNLEPTTWAVVRTNGTEWVNVTGDGTITVGITQAQFAEGGFLTPFYLGMGLAGVVGAFTLGARAIGAGMGEKITFKD